MTFTLLLKLLSVANGHFILVSPHQECLRRVSFYQLRPRKPKAIFEGFLAQAIVVTNLKEFSKKLPYKKVLARK